MKETIDDILTELFCKGWQEAVHEIEKALEEKNKEIEKLKRYIEAINRWIDSNIEAGNIYCYDTTPFPKLEDKK